ncbi:MAG: putative flap endonuclease-1-like 5' DNA nuclease [Verrucomicrobiales bacterium]|jgi:predicted flap endonuclease-1-like 5' DNA nuclease
MFAYTIGQWIIMLLVALFFFCSGAWFGRIRSDAMHAHGGDDDGVKKKPEVDEPASPETRVEALTEVEAAHVDSKPGAVSESVSARPDSGAAAAVKHEYSQHVAPVKKAVVKAANLTETAEAAGKPAPAAKKSVASAKPAAKATAVPKAKAKAKPVAKPAAKPVAKPAAKTTAKTPAAKTSPKKKTAAKGSAPRVKDLARTSSLTSVSEAAQRASIRQPKSKAAATAKKAPAKNATAGKAKNDLKKINGVGPVIEKRLNKAGVSTYAEIAAWTAKDVKSWSDELAFGDRITREKWVAQAKKLAKS